MSRTAFWRVQVRAEKVVEVPSRADAGFAAAPVFGGAALGVVALGLRGEWTLWDTLDTLQGHRDMKQWGGRGGCGCGL